MTPIEALFEVLRTEGVSRVFGNPGTTELPFVDALVDHPDIEYVLAMHEASAVSMADGYARSTGRPAFVNLHVAAGLANGLVSMLNAKRSYTPLVVTAGQQDRRHMVNDPMLSGDLIALASGAAKHTFDVQHSYDLPIVLRRAFALASQPPEGPVFVSIPVDLLAEDTEVDVPARSTVAPLPAAAEIESMAAILAGARRPAIIAGNGVGRGGAVAELVTVAEALGAAVYPEPLPDAVNFPANHPLASGFLQPSNTSIRSTLSKHDLVFVVCSHAFMAHYYAPGPAIPDGTTVVQLDTDAAEIGRNFPVALGAVGGIAASLAELGRCLTDRAPDAAGRVAEITAGTRSQRATVDAEALAHYGEAPLDPLAVGHAITSGLPDDAIVIDESITAGQRFRPVMRLDRPGSYHHTIGGGLGWGIGAAIGTRLAQPGRPVVAVIGDGATMFGLQGLWSAARYQVPVLLLVMNNGEYRVLKESLDRTKSRSTEMGKYIGVDLTPPELDWCTAARFFGLNGVRVGSAAELRDIVAGSANLREALVVDVPITGHRPPIGAVGS